MQRLNFFLWLVTAIFLLGSTALFAQNSAGINGTVTTVSGSPIAGVTVSIINLGTQAITTAVSDAGGAFSSTNLPAGSYMITSSMRGFDVLTRNGIQLTPGQTLAEHLSMQVAATAESVTVRQA